VMKFWAA